jgi:hypothetical protein
MAMTAMAVGMVAVAWRRVIAAYLAGALTMATGIWGASEFLRRWVVVAGPDRVVVAGLGLLAVVAVLWAVGGFVRRGDPDATLGDPLDLPARSVAFAFDRPTGRR